MRRLPHHRTHEAVSARYLSAPTTKEALPSSFPSCSAISQRGSTLTSKPSFRLSPALTLTGFYLFRVPKNRNVVRFQGLSCALFAEADVRIRIRWRIVTVHCPRRQVAIVRVVTATETTHSNRLQKCSRPIGNLSFPQPSATHYYLFTSSVVLMRASGFFFLLPTHNL